MLDPRRSDRRRGKKNEKPVATLQGNPDFVVPLLGSQEIGLAIPYWYPVSTNDLGYPGGESPIFARVRKKHLERQPSGTLTHLFAVSFFAIGFLAFNFSTRR